MQASRCGGGRMARTTQTAAERVGRHRRTMPTSPPPLQPVTGGREDKERAGSRRSGTGLTGLDGQKAAVGV